MDLAFKRRGDNVSETRVVVAEVGRVQVVGVLDVCATGERKYEDRKTRYGHEVQWQVVQDSEAEYESNQRKSLIPGCS